LITQILGDLLRDFLNLSTLQILSLLLFLYYEIINLHLEFGTSSCVNTEVEVEFLKVNMPLHSQSLGTRIAMHVTHASALYITQNNEMAFAFIYAYHIIK